MRRSVPLVLTALSVPAVVLALAMPAYAKGGPPPGKGGPHAQGGTHPNGPPANPVMANCSTLGGTTTAPTLSGCLPMNATGGVGVLTFTGGLTLSGDGMVAWTGTGTTSFHYSASLPQSNGNKCTKVAKGDTEAIIHGAVSGNVTQGGSPGVKGAVHAKVCESTTGGLSLLPGSGPFKI
jgi:hypothetical protein